MIPLAMDGLRSILCLGAHADDIEIGCGGTILRLLQAHESLAIHWIVLGTAGARSEEAAASARRFLGDTAEKNIIVKGFRDSYFPYIGGEIKEYLEEVRTQVSPDVILTHYHDDRHQDHRLVSELTWCAFRDHLILEYEIPKYDGDLWRPNLYVPLDEAICRQKIETIMECFPSQHDKNWFSEDTYWALLRLRGVESHSPSKFAEAFYARKLTL